MLLQLSLHRTSCSCWCLIESMCLSIHLDVCVYVRCPYIFWVPGVLGPCFQGCWLLHFYKNSYFQAYEVYIVYVFFFKVCFSLCVQLWLLLLLHLWQLCAPDITHHYDCYNSPTTVGVAVLGQLDVVLPPQLIPRDIMKGSVDLVTLLQQQ